MTPGPGPDPYAGPVCPEPECNRVAYAYRGGHAPDCPFWAPTPPRKGTTPRPAATSRFANRESTD